MSSKLTFKVESQGKPYAVMVLNDGVVTARMGRSVLRGAMLWQALLWVKQRNPNPGVEAQVTIVGKF